MPSIVVARYTGDRQGEDIVDRLLSSVDAQLSRGRAELDANATLQQTVDLTIVYRQGLELGQLVEVHDALQGRSYRGKITGISHRIDGGQVVTVLNILKPLEA
jgi:hypothetical protein